MGVYITVRIGPVVKLGQFNIESNEIKTINGCPNCNKKTKDSFCKDCGSAIKTFDTCVKKYTDTAHDLLWDISSTNSKLVDDFYVTEDFENYIIPNFITPNTYTIDGYGVLSEFISVPSVSEQNEAIYDVETNDGYKTIKEFCDKHDIECEVVYAIISYWI